MKLSLLSMASVAAAQGLALDFNVYRGNDRNNIDKSSDGISFVKRDGSLDMEISNQQTFYMVDLAIGQNGDKVGVLVDTGSSDLWVMSADLDCEYSNSKRDSRRVIRGASPTVERDQVRRRDTFSTITIEGTSLPSDLSIPGIPLGTSIPSASSGSGSGSGSGSSNPVPSGSNSGSNQCVKYGAFNEGKSSSFHKNSSAPSFLINYADGTYASGEWGYDNVKINNVTVNDLSFAVVTNTSSDVGVLGIGLAGLEVTYSNSGSRNSAYQYENLPLKLKNDGIIEKTVYSIYLNSANAKTGSILFGAVDHAKYNGTLTTVPIINTQQSLGYNSPIRIEVVVDGVAVNASSQSYSVGSGTYSAVLDTGSTLSYFPTALASNLAEILGAKYDPRFQGYLMTCTDDVSNVLTYNFSGQEISVPIPNLLTQVSRNTCLLGVSPSSSDFLLLGDNFIRSAYLVFDLEDLEVSIAPANYNSDSNVEIISSSVPSATQAPNYSSTSLNTGSVGSATRTASLRTGTPSGSSNSGTKGSAGSKTYAYIWPVVAALAFVTFF